MARDSLKQAHGNWVEGDRFWGREQDITIFRKYVDEGAHVLLVAQRRMGKTSLMRETARRLELENLYHCLFVDFQKASSASDAMVALSLAIHEHKPLWKKTKEVFSNILSKVAGAIDRVQVGDLGVTLRAGLTLGNWAEKGDQLLGILAASERPVLILMDEVPILVNRMLKGENHTITPERKSQTDEFMSWLRQNSIAHQGKLRMVISGSIGLEPILRQAGLSATINNFTPYELKPWDEETAVGCLNALANEYGLQFHDNAPSEMVRRLGCCIPHHVQMFFRHVHDRCIRRKTMDFHCEEVAEVYDNEMLSSRGHAELTHYEERLKQILGAELFTLALEMLTEASVTGCLGREALEALRSYIDASNRDAAEIQNDILWVLEHDGYLERREKGYVFVSDLLRDWWRARHSFTFTPVLKRGA